MARHHTSIAPDQLRLLDGVLMHKQGRDINEYLLKAFNEPGVQIPVVLVHRDHFQQLLDLRWMNVSA